MGWARFDDGYMDHPKIMEVGLMAEMLDRRAIEHCAKYETDGLVTRPALRRIGRDVTRVQLRVEALIAAGRWEANIGGGWWVHDFLKYNPSKAQKDAERAKARERMATARSGRSSGRSSDYSRGGGESLERKSNASKLISRCVRCDRLDLDCECPELEVIEGGA